MSVSYTHLDVYKRQEKSITGSAVGYTPSPQALFVVNTQHARFGAGRNDNGFALDGLFVSDNPFDVKMCIRDRPYCWGKCGKLCANCGRRQR